MTDHDHDLCDLIAELDGLHYWESDDVSPAGQCAECLQTRPCPTSVILDKYKRRAHRRKYIVNAPEPRVFAWGPGEAPPEYTVTTKPGGNTVHRAATPDQCHAWIEQQYEENK